MYNLSIDEISMVDGGGDGGAVTGFVAGYIAGKVLDSGLSAINRALHGNGNFGSGLNRTGSNQSYSSQGRDTGGCTMQRGGAMAQGRC